MCTPSKRRLSAVVAEEHQNANRRLHRKMRGIVYQDDPRHVDMLVEDLGLEHGNSVQTPATRDVTEEEESEPLG